MNIKSQEYSRINETGHYGRASPVSNIHSPLDTLNITNPYNTIEYPVEKMLMFSKNTSNAFVRNRKGWCEVLPQ